MFFFFYHILFDRVFYNGVPNIPLLFWMSIRLNQMHIQGGLIIYLKLISGMITIEAGIYGLSGGNKLEGG